MAILQLIENTGNSYKRKASTFGGEYSGPCPFCHGTDRFSIHPNRDHFVCRKCKKAGDSIKFVREYHNKNYFEACKFLNITPNIQRKVLNITTEKPGQNELATNWQPREINIPSKIWQEKATAILFESYKYLLSASGKKQRDWLNDRGISNKTIKASRMGWNIHSISFDQESWGVVSTNQQKYNHESASEFKPIKIWLPKGLIIPQFYKQQLIRLRIRQADPGEFSRFIMVKGSAMGYMDCDLHMLGNK